MNKTAFLNMIVARAKEKSTYVAIAAGLSALGISVGDEWIQPISMVGAGLAMIAGIVFPEKGPQA